MGAAVALPLLDAMVPALTALGADAQARPRTPLRRDLHSQRRDHGAVDPGGRRRRVRVQADPQAARAVQGSAGRRHQPDAVASGQPGGRPRGERRRLPDRRVAEAHRSRGRARQHHHRSGRGAADRTGHAVPVARSGHRGLHRLRRRLLAGLQLRLPEHGVVELADHAAADGHQPARRVRADVRPGGQPRRSAPARMRDERSMLDSITAGSATAAARARRRATARASASTSTTCARSSGASSAPRRTTAPT